MTLQAMFQATGDDYGEFDKVENPPCKRADLSAFIMLDRLQPGGADIISASEHDEFFLSTDCDELAKVVTLEIVRDLARCGIRYSADFDCLCMFA
jgi:hypothetical protein